MVVHSGHRLETASSFPETQQVHDSRIIGLRDVLKTGAASAGDPFGGKRRPATGRDWPERTLHGTLLASSKASTTDASFRERSQDALSEKSQPHQEDPQAGLSCAHEDQCRKEDHQPPASPWPFDQCSLSDSPSARRPSSNIEETLTNHDRLNRTNRGPGRTSRIRKEHRGRDARRRARGPLS